MVVSIMCRDYREQSGAFQRSGSHINDKVRQAGTERIYYMLLYALVIDRFRAWKPPLYHKDTANGKKFSYCGQGALGTLSCGFMVYESCCSMISTNESAVSGWIWTNESGSTLPGVDRPGL